MAPSRDGSRFLGGVKNSRYPGGIDKNLLEYLVLLIEKSNI